MPSTCVDDLDREAVHAVAGGDRTAFERLYRRYHPLLLRFLRRFTTRADLMEDVVNEAMLVVWRGAGGFKGQSKVSTWVIGVAYRCMLVALKRAPTWQPFEEEDLPCDDDGGRMHYPHMPQADPSADRELRNWLEQGLKALPPDQRLTIELAYLVGQSCDEIATIMGCPVGTVKARMFHARARLRSVLPVIGGDAAVRNERGGEAGGMGDAGDTGKRATP